MTRVLRNSEKDDGSFDLEFWQRQGAEAIFAAAWEMVSGVSEFRGEGADEPRLQRFVCRTKLGLKTPKPSFDFLSFDEAERLLLAAAEEPDWCTMFLFAMRTNLRQGELLALTCMTSTS